MAGPVNQSLTVSVYSDTAQVEACAVVKANFNANVEMFIQTFQIQRLWKIVAINAVKCLVG